MELDPLSDVTVLGLQRRTAAVSPDKPATVTHLLSSRVGSVERAAIRDALVPHRSLGTLYAQADALSRLRLEIQLPPFLELGHVLEAVGLPGPLPPAPDGASTLERVASSGDPAGADLIADLLDAAGNELARNHVAERHGDFGRRLRLLAGAYSGATWTAAPDVAGEGKWLREHLPGLDVAPTSHDGVLGLGPESVDALVDLHSLRDSSAGDALRAMGETQRVVRSRGAAVLQLRGLHSVAHDVERGLMGPVAAAGVIRGLYRAGHHVVGGVAFLTLEWLMTHLHDHWSLEVYRPGRTAERDDALVLRRRG